MLKKHCVYVDDFRIKQDYHTCNNIPLLLLTHAHADHHGRSIEKFKHIVCSAATALILNNLNQPIIVEAGKTYQYNRDVVFSVFNTIHSPGSIGFYFHTLNVLHLGDGRIDYEFTQTISKIISTSKYYNGKNILINKDRNDFKHNILKYPKLETSRINLFHLWQQYGDKLVLAMHSDALNLLLNNIFTPFPLAKYHHKVISVRESVNRSMSMLPKTDRQILVCGRLPRDKNFIRYYPNHVFVEPSLLWYVNDKIPRDPYMVTKDSRGVWRIFLSSHASPNESDVLVNVVQNMEKK
jgi:hypothetical protein